jgi:hypothetical protein
MSCFIHRQEVPKAQTKEQYKRIHTHMQRPQGRENFLWTGTCCLMRWGVYPSLQYHVSYEHTAWIWHKTYKSTEETQWRKLFYPVKWSFVCMLDDAMIYIHVHVYVYIRTYTHTYVYISSLFFCINLDVRRHGNLRFHIRTADCTAT